MIQTVSMYGEAEEGGGVVLLAGAEGGGWPSGVVGGIGVLLRFEADGVAAGIDFTSFADDGAI